MRLDWYLWTSLFSNLFFGSEFYPENFQGASTIIHAHEHTHV